MCPAGGARFVYLQCFGGVRCRLRLGFKDRGLGFRRLGSNPRPKLGCKGEILNLLFRLVFGLWALVVEMNPPTPGSVILLSKGSALLQTNVEPETAPFTRIVVYIGYVFWFHVSLGRVCTSIHHVRRSSAKKR